ncbi:FAD/NAD(P)-binding protein [Frondihabitans cladoniiphilus]|uniref:FAD/NAD(P)-binding protein n=1 Tax=Frondihabitans cladoniiphilus TaxID=715785 RepID=A0ABP8W5E9_9MICO
MLSIPPSVIVVGGGASAVFVAWALHEQAAALGVPQPSVTVVGTGPGVGTEPGVGRGLAYGRADAHHRLNSPARSMSVSASDDGGFVRWLEESGWRDTDGAGATPGAFVPRRVFGDYVAGSFERLLADPSARVAFRQGEVVEVAGADVGASGGDGYVGGADAGGDASGVVVTLADGSVLTADHVVLALGNPPPVEVPSTAARTIVDPWVPGALDGIVESDRVLLIGTGLTAVDIATSLARRLPSLRIVATSRHLLLPAVHPPFPVPAGGGLGDVRSLPQMMRAFHERLRDAERDGTPWQGVLDGVRPEVQALWMRLSLDERRRFLGHVARRWDVHRHRMAAAVWQELSGLFDAGTLSLRADVEHADFDVAITCTGPRSVADRGWSPLVDALLDSGAVRPDPLGLGFDADPDGALPGTDGRLFAVGAALKGALWETVAVPEIRQVASRVAGRILVPFGSASAPASAAP